MPSQPRPSRTALPAAVSMLVARLVDGPAVPATVVAAYRFGLYLDVAGELVPVVTSDAVPLPTAVRLAVPAGSLEWGAAPGDRVTVGGGRVALPVLDVVGARTWRPSRVRPAPSPPGCSTGGPDAHLDPDGELRVGDLLRQVAAERCDAWLLEALDPVTTHGERAVRALLGRGRGLTPSGDDALAGALLVCHAHGIHDDLAAAAQTRLDRTTAVSAALLRSAADGYAARDVVTLVDAAVAGDTGAVARSLPAVLGIGHTSGADLVAGVQAALSARAPGVGDRGGGRSSHLSTQPEKTTTGRSAA